MNNDEADQETNDEARSMLMLIKYQMSRLTHRTDGHADEIGKNTKEIAVLQTRVTHVEDSLHASEPTVEVNNNANQQGQAEFRGASVWGLVIVVIVVAAVAFMSYSVVNMRPGVDAKQPAEQPIEVMP